MGQVTLLDFLLNRARKEPIRMPCLFGRLVLACLLKKWSFLFGLLYCFLSLDIQFTVILNALDLFGMLTEWYPEILELLISPYVYAISALESTYAIFWFIDFLKNPLILFFQVYLPLFVVLIINSMLLTCSFALAR